MPQPTITHIVAVCRVMLNQYGVLKLLISGEHHLEAEILQ